MYIAFGFGAADDHGGHIVKVIAEKAFHFIPPDGIIGTVQHIFIFFNIVYLAGEGVSTYDLMNTVTADMMKVNLLAIAAVFIVLLLTMRSVALPVILVLTIETAIWINLSVPYLLDKPLFYIAYLIISSIQLGYLLGRCSPELLDGIQKLADGSEELADGAKELKDGAEELRDGMEELNEDGIQKLVRCFNEDIEKLIDRMRAEQDAGAE